MDVSGTLFQDSPSTCNHHRIRCTELECQCWCDGCQAVFEEMWAIEVRAQGCCCHCGMPAAPITLGLLAKTSMLHFYSPCEGCKKDYELCMELAGLCSICRTKPYIDAEGSIECKCTASAEPTQ